MSCAELQISALCAMDAAARVQLELFRQSSTLGVRQAPPARPPPQPPGGGVGVLLAYQPWHARAHRGVLGVLTPGHFRPALQTLVQRFALERRWVELAHPLGTVRVGRRPKPTHPGSATQCARRTPVHWHARADSPFRTGAQPRTQLARGHSSPRRTQANAQRRASPPVLLTRRAVGASSSCSVLFRGHRRELSGHF